MQRKNTLEEEIQESIITTVKKIANRESLIKINTTVQFWYKQQEKKEG